MADNLIFPIGFDLDKAVADASKDWNDTFAEKLEKRIAKKPVNVKLKFDLSKIDQLDKVKERLAKLKLEPITPETKSAIKQLAAELQTLAKALEQVQKFSAGRATASPDAVRAARINEINERSLAKAKTEAERAAAQAALAENRLAAARLKDARAAQVNEKTTRNASKAYSEQSTYLQRLTQRMAAYWSIQQVGNFLTNVREVTAQFELQRISLGAIIQDQTRANQLFSEIKNFALKSPVKIMDLTKYTKQLAAYKVGWDGIKTDTKELFDWTKKLTDVSVGLGVSMDRVVLAFGQVRATGYLRASEIRQFTEMGVPIVEELAAKLSKMNGELVTAADVMDLVSKRGISFELVKEVFDDMTSAGGMFYNIQEKQGNTLFGMWAKLGDAASVMYDQIGNTESVNKGMKDAIGLLTEFMRNWKAVGKTMALEALGAGVFLLMKKASALGDAVAASNAKIAAATAARVAAQQALNTALQTGTLTEIKAAQATLAKAQADEKAALSVQKHALSLKSLSISLKNIGTGFIALGKTLLSGAIFGVAITAVSTLVYKFFEAYENAHRLGNALKDISSETGTLQSQSVTNFESLANAAVKAADGSKAQRDAMEELIRTYRNIIPEQDLTIEKLREMKGNYEALTSAIEEYIRQQQFQKGLSTISEEYGKRMLDANKELQESLKDFNFGTSLKPIKLGREQIDRIVSNFKELVNEGKNYKDAMRDAFSFEGIDVSTTFATRYLNAFEELSEVMVEQKKDIEDWEKTIQDSHSSLRNFAKYIDEAAKVVESHNFKAEKGTFAFDEENAKVTVNAYVDAFKKALNEAGVKINLAEYITMDEKGMPIVDWNSIDNIILGLNNKMKVPLQNMSTEVQKHYNEFIPKSATVAQIRNKFIQITDSLGLNIDKMKQYLWDGSGDVDDYLKRLKEQQDKLKKLLKEKEQTLLQMAWYSRIWNKLQGKDIEAEIENLKKQIKAFDEQIKFTEGYTVQDEKKNKGRKSGGTKSDPRLSILQEMVSTLKQVNKEYDELAKKEGATRALTDTQKVYDATFKNMQSLAKKYRFSLPKLDVPTDTKSLTGYLNKIREAMKKLPKSDKAVLALQVDIDKLDIDEQQRKIEEQLRRLSDNVSRTKTAQEFYSRILGTTGDVDLAMNVTTAIYGDAGTDVQAQMAKYVSSLFGQVDVEVPVNLISEDGTIDYTAMEKYVLANKDILSKSYDELLKIARDGQKNLAKTYEGYLKDLEVAKTYADKRVELARDTANNIIAIEKTIAEAKKKLAEAEAQGDTKEADRLRDVIKSYEGLPQQYLEREARKAAKLEYEAFKDTPLYTQMFEDLDYASTSALTRMRDRLVSLKDQWKNLDPTQLKELQKRLEDIDSQLAARNPFKALADAYKQWRDLRKSGRTKEGDELAADNAEKERRAAEAKMIADEKAYQVAVNKYGAESDAAKAAREAADASKDAYENAEKGANEAANNADEWKQIADKARKAAAAIAIYTEKFNEAAEGIREMLDAFGASDEDKQYFEDIVDGFNKISKGGQQAAESFARFSSGDIFGGVTAGVGAIGKIVSGFSNLFSAGRVRRANKEIKRQQEIIDQLTYSYSRLEKAMDKAFGNDYIQNYQQQIGNLYAQIEAAEKQLAAEHSKGKKKNEDAIKEYEARIRALKDQIADMKGKVVEQFVGSDITSAARDFANAWIDAKKSFESTTDAMEEKFKDMVQNMIVETLAGAVIERALQPFYNAVDYLRKDGDFSAEDIATAAKVGMEAMKEANAGMEVLWEQLKAAGLDVNQFLTDKQEGYTGIAKDVAGATSEEINAVASIGNTVMYHTSFLPLIYQQLVARAGGGVTQPIQQAQAGWTDWQQQAMSSYLAIQQNTADTVVECRRSAQACENIANQLSRVIRTKGSTTGVNTFLNN